jgi:hypothetical protein
VRCKAGDSFPMTLDLNADITGATAVLVKAMRSVTGVFAFSTAATIIDATNGLISITPTAGQTATPGALVLETKVTFAGGAIQTFPGSSHNEIVIDPAVPAA